MKTFEIHPGTGWRTARRITQALAIIAMLVGPLLGGWQRAERGTLSAWQMQSWDFPEWFATSLPEAPSDEVHAANKLMGGGGAVDYFALPVSDPVASTAALVAGQNNWLAVVAWAIPVVLALLFGRVFCGWFCPFGVLARGLDRFLSLIPIRHRGFEIPRRRPLRWVLLGLAIVGGAIGGQWVAFVFLPHVLFQASLYSMILLGGIGAVGGATLGLVAMGLVFGPTIYCSAICPTGAALGALGRARRVHVEVIDPATCGSCTLCHRACWLGLEPAATGDPGPDCDLCTRCFTACPKAKMVVRAGLTRPRGATKAAASAAAALMLAIFSADASALDAATHKPAMVLNGYRELPTHSVALTVIDRTGMQFTQDTARDFGVEISAYVVTGDKDACEEEGRRAVDGDVHQGPLTITTTRASGELIERLEFAHPTSPISTPNRTIFRRKRTYRLFPGDLVTIEPIAGVFDEPQTWTVPEVHPARDGHVLWFFASAALMFGGLLAMAVSFRVREDEE